MQQGRRGVLWLGEGGLQVDQAAAALPEAQHQLLLANYLHLPTSRGCRKNVVREDRREDIEGKTLKGRHQNTNGSMKPCFAEILAAKSRHAAELTKAKEQMVASLP